MIKRDFKKYVCDSGSPEKNIYKPKIDKNGQVNLINVGKDNIYLKIQSERDSCDIQVLLKRFTSGDVDAINQRNGFYADISNMPSTYLDMLNTVKGAEDTFNRLPLEVRQRFENNFNIWFSTMDRPDWFEKMKMKKEDKDKLVKESEEKKE